MKSEQVNLRLELELIAGIERAAREDGVDRGTMIRKLVFEALKRRRLEQALRHYRDGSWSPGQAAEAAGISHWELIDLARAGAVAHPITEERAEAHLRRLLPRDERVAEFAPAYRAGGGRPKPLDTLPDYAPARGGVLVVGVNPAPRSVRAGHYWQGKHGRQLWKRLARLGLLTDAVPGCEDEAFVAAGNGLTDVVKRPARSIAEVSKTELRDGAVRLREDVRRWKPRIVLFVYAIAARAALGVAECKPGRCGAIEGSIAFLLSGPYAKRAVATRVDAELIALLGRDRNGSHHT